MNNLIGAFLTACVRLTPSETPDGMGGFRTQWEKGAGFQAAVTKTGTSASQIAERRGASEAYKVTTPAGVGLEFDDVFQRVADGATFRVTSNWTDSRPPKCAGFSFERVTAERWEPV